RVVDVLDGAVPLLWSLVPAALTMLFWVLAVLAIYRLFERRCSRGDRGRVARQLVMISLTAVLVVALIMALPIDGTQRGQLLSLLGLLLSAAIALASTTFLGNAIAGLMVRAVEDFRPGDFIHVGEHFGRVSERGLLHVEIQSEDRDLITIPNLQIVSNPVRVVRASGTIVSASVSLGYDVDHVAVEALLLGAVEASGLSDGFVLVTDLGDFAVTYRAAGFLKDVGHLISTRSKLRTSVLDALHAGGVEIVSPNFMNQRVLAPEQRFVPDPGARHPATGESGSAEVERIVFDKAEQAALREQLGERHARFVEMRARLQAEQAAASSDDEKQRLAGQIERLDPVIERLALALAEPPDEE
ncbi:MAG: mechanosensitive ion channel family protein, partial [Myxococcota bacterium]